VSEKTEKKRLAILRVLRESGKPLSGSRITEELWAEGHEISERTVRLYLHVLDEEGLTQNVRRAGRIVTQLGLQELGNANIIEKVGFLAAKIDQMTYRMNFDLATRTGTIVMNVSMMKRSRLEDAARLMKEVFEAKYAMGRLIALFSPGEKVGEATIAEGMIGVGTVCSITLNGVLLAHGIPTYSRFGGLLELQDYKPTRFVEVIHYSGTTLDPLEVFIRSGMTDSAAATDTGNGRIGASFRELPAESREQVTTLARQLDQVGLGGFMTIGWPGQPLLEIPVQQERVGAIVMGGLNPIAILEENGIRTHLHALAALADYRVFFPYDELDTRIRNLT